MSGCGTKRSAVYESRDKVATYREADSVIQSALEEARDSVVERTTVTVDRKENGDTVRVCIVTDRERVSSRDNRAAVVTKTEVRVDTVYVERRDSVNIRSPATNGQSGRTALQSMLKWIFAIIIGLIALVIVLRFRRL